MKPLTLRLKGFAGIRDGLGLDEVTLDLQALPAHAQLVAIGGANGKGKTTLMDNLHPYPVMPSRAGQDGAGGVGGVGGFSYYEHLCASQAEKDLVWEHGGRRFRSHLVFRCAGKRKTEAFLFEAARQQATPMDHPTGPALTGPFFTGHSTAALPLNGATSAGTHAVDKESWVPMRLADGTVSDGKMEAYERCVEALLGSAQTFFTSVFSAQGKRQLSALRNGEVKTLLADLLGLEAIGAQGQRASETARLLKAGLTTLRQERASVEAERTRASQALGMLGNTAAAVAGAQRAKELAAATLARAQAQVSQLQGERAAGAVHLSRRQQLTGERIEAQRACAVDAQSFEAAMQREAARITQADTQAKQRATQTQQRLATLCSRERQVSTLLSNAAAIGRAQRRSPLAQQVTAQWQERLTLWQAQGERLKEAQRQMQSHAERIASIEREAGQASLRVSDLARRLALSTEVPCAGTDLQGRCQLLGDAHQASELKPSADAQVARLAEDRRVAQLAHTAQQAVVDALADAPAQRAYAQSRLSVASERAKRLEALASQQATLAHAQADLQGIRAERAEITTADKAAQAQEDAQRQEAAQVRATLEAQKREHCARHQALLVRIDSALAELPAAFDDSRLQAAQAQCEQASAALANADAAHGQAVSNSRAAQVTTADLARHTQRLVGLDARLSRCEREVSTWTLLAKALSHDGVIALCIDDAGPSLAALANDLLLSCYGPRFTVAIHTLVETAKGQAREGFDIIVHDAESGQAKSVTLMSGGERVWINEALTRAVALYLAQGSNGGTGERYATLFSDEADGPLDPERKRMFVAMKREVLALGGYEREFFISQTPELTALADAVIDVEALRHIAPQQRRGPCPPMGGPT